jgi:hypothetical protein
VEIEIQSEKVLQITFPSSRRIRNGNRRHAERDTCPLSRLTRNLHLAAVEQHNALHNRQSQPSTARSLGA